MNSNSFENILFQGQTATGLVNPSDRNPGNPDTAPSQFVLHPVMNHGEKKQPAAIQDSAASKNHFTHSFFCSPAAASLAQQDDPLAEELMKIDDEIRENEWLRAARGIGGGGGNGGGAAVSKQTN